MSSDLDQLLSRAREIWGDRTMSREEIAVAMGVVYGDICRLVRDANEKGELDDEELKKELGNIIFSTIRWADDLGYDVQECIELAREAQKAFVDRQEK